MERTAAKPKPAWTKYSSGSRVDHFAWWCETYLIQSIDQFANEPLILEPWQIDFMGEALAMESADGLTPKWRSLALCVSRKNGKTALLAGYALYSLLTDDTQPEILLAAASDKQAGRLFDACTAYIRKNPELAAQVVLRDYIGEIARADGGGKILRMASDPNTLHGYSPSLVVADELAFWTKPMQRKAWAALTTGGGARKKTQTMTISTAGDANERDTSILGSMVNRNEAVGDVEKTPGLTISRNHDAATLIYNYSAPTKDPTDIAAMQLANPASWITDDYLQRQANNPEISIEEVLQLHGCVWVAGSSAWISADWWNNAIERDAKIPDGARVSIGIDVGIVHDATACVVAYQRPDDEKVLIEAKIWTPQPGKNVDLADVEAHLRELTARFAVAGVFYDPRFFERSAQALDDEGVTMVTMVQSSAIMADAYQAFYSMLGEGRIIHAGNDVELAAHVLSTAAAQTDRGWKISKIRQRQRIDALVAAVMANYGAILQTEGEQSAPGFYAF